MAHEEIEVILARQLASYLAMPIFIVDPQGTLLYYNLIEWVGQNSDRRPPAIFGGVPAAGHRAAGPVAGPERLFVRLGGAGGVPPGSQHPSADRRWPRDRDTTQI